MKGGKRKENLSASAEAFEILGAYDHQIVQFSPYHFRVNNRLDVWPSTKKAYDIRSHRKFQYDDLVDFVMRRFEEIKSAAAVYNKRVWMTSRRSTLHTSNPKSGS